MNDFDVIVVGGGNAAFAAALSAKENGAKRVVVLWQGGGPSHVDLFDDKPVMRKMAGKDIPESVRGTTRLSTMSSSVPAHGHVH